MSLNAPTREIFDGTSLAITHAEGDLLPVKGDLHFEDKVSITREILAYLHDHPNAQDTIEGIMQWWLLERKIKHQQAVVEEALVELFNEGLILKHVKSDKSEHFHLNENKMNEIKMLLKNLKEANGKHTKSNG